MAEWLSEVRNKLHDIIDTGMGLVVLLLVAVGAAIIFFNQNYEANRRSGVPVIAAITVLRTAASGKYQPGLLVQVYATDAHGVSGSEAFPLFELAGCKVGDQIRAKRAGMTLILEPAPCPISRAVG